MLVYFPTKFKRITTDYILYRFNQASPFVVDMATAEDDEIVLQEVIIDRSEAQKPLVQRSDSLQIPGAIPKVKEPLSSRLRGLSPKIAPKFPREKLKSMFRKRRLSSAFPFYKLKGVRFTRDTKKDDPLVNQSLLDVSGHEGLDVEITLSTPELTEAEKETGIHPYYYTQQTITSAKQLVTGKAVAMRQPSLTRSESEDKKFKGHRMGRHLVRHNSLPNISHFDEYAQYVQYPIIESSLKKISEVMKEKEAARKEDAKKEESEKEKSKRDESKREKLKKEQPKKEQSKSKMKRKSPPPPKPMPTPEDSAQESETFSDTEPPRRCTLPEITVTRCERRSSEHSDIPTPGDHPQQSSDSDSDSSRKKSQGSHKGKPQSQKSSQEKVPRTSPPEVKVEAAPESHSTSRQPRRTSPKHAKTVTTEPKEDTRRVPIRRKSPPPKLPEKLAFRKYTPTKKIAGIALKSERAPASPPISPSSPVSFIPSTAAVGRTPPFPKTEQSAVAADPVTQRHSPTAEAPSFGIQYPSAKADTTITISDSKEDLRQVVTEQPCPPALPQRHIPRAGGKGKK